MDYGWGGTREREGLGKGGLGKGGLGESACIRTVAVTISRSTKCFDLISPQN